MSEAQVETITTAPLLEAAEEIRHANERRRVSLEVNNELSERALMAMAIYSAEVSAS